MIVTVNTPQTRAQFLGAVGESPPLQAQLTMRLALFGDLTGSGWQFYTTQSDAAQVPQGIDTQEGTQLAVQPTLPCGNAMFQLSPLAIALRGASATVAGAFDPEELGSFLAFLGITTITTPAATPPQGYAYKQTLTVYTLSAGKQLALPPLTGAFAEQVGACAQQNKETALAAYSAPVSATCVAASGFSLERTPSVAASIPLLFGEEAAEVQDQYYADGCTARNNGMAEFWLLHHQGKPIFTLAASAVVDGIAYLSAGETIEAYRGQGIGGQCIALMANEYAAKGYEVCFVCEAVRCRFYERLGFTKQGVLYQYAPLP